MLFIHVLNIYTCNYFMMFNSPSYAKLDYRMTCD